MYILDEASDLVEDGTVSDVARGFLQGIDDFYGRCLFSLETAQVALISLMLVARGCTIQDALQSLLVFPFDGNFPRDVDGVLLYIVELFVKFKVARHGGRHSCCWLFSEMVVVSKGGTEKGPP